MGFLKLFIKNYSGGYCISFDFFFLKKIEKSINHKDKTHVCEHVKMST